MNKKNQIITVTLSIILFIVPVLIKPNTGLIFYNYNVPKIIILLLCGLVLLISTLLKIDKLKFDKTDILIIVFGVLSILSTIFSKNVPKSLIGEDNRFEGLYTIIIYYNAKYYFNSYKKFLTLALITYISICIFAIIQFYVGNFINLPPIFSGGANGTFGNTNFMGSFVSIVLPAMILGAILFNKKIYYIGSAIAYSAMLACTARSSWVAFIVYIFAIIIYLIKKHRKKYFKRFFIIGMIFIFCFGFIKITDKYNRIENKTTNLQKEIKEIKNVGLTNKTGSGRIGIWKSVIKLITKVPITGCGVDALSDGLIEECPDECKEIGIGSSIYVDKAHNEYLQIAATMGIPALIVYLIFIGQIVIGGMKRMAKSKLATIYTITIISYLAQAFFNISTIGIAPIFWFILRNSI